MLFRPTLILAVFFGILSAHAIIFEEGDRKERFELKSRAVRRYSKSTAALAFRETFKRSSQRPDADYEVDFSLKGSGRVKADPVCPDAFVGEPELVSYCSSTLIGDDLLLTAGHCFDRGPTMTPESICERTVAIFDYAVKKKDWDPVRFPAKNVYQCKKLEAFYPGENAGEIDFAIVRLDRKVRGRKIFRVRTKVVEPMKAGDPFISSGYPKGFPNKTMENGEFVRYSKYPNNAFGRLSAQGGSSGSSLLDKKNHEIIGILVGSDCLDYQWDDGKQCYFEPVFHGQCIGIRMILAEKIAELVPGLIP